MSRIDDMIREMCPDGVEFRALGEVADLRRGSGMPKSTFTDDGVPAIHYGHIYTRYGVYAGAAAAHVPSDVAESLQPVHRGELVIANTSENLEDVGMAVAWLGDSNAVTGGHATVVSSGVLDSKFLSYYVRTPAFFAQKRRFAFGTKVIELSAVNLAKIPVPVPPMSIQREIVGILEQFTELEAELEAELKARRVQYASWVSRLITSSSSVALGNVASFEYGLTASAVDEGSCRFVRITDIAPDGTLRKEGAKYLADEPDMGRFGLKSGDLVVARTGATFGRTLYIDDAAPMAYASYLIRVVPDLTRLDPRFYWHFSRSVDYWSQANSLVSVAGQPQFNANALGRIRVPLRPVAEQRRIADQLDVLSRLTTDLVSGLPAEIAARRQQYEYYRDQLLTFPEKKAGA